MLALPRNSATTIAHLIAQCSRRSRAGMAANVAPVIAHVRRLYRALVALSLRSAGAMHAHITRPARAVTCALITLHIRHSCAKHAR